MGMEFYSAQLLMMAGFLGELIIHGVTGWAYFFVIMMVLFFIPNFVSEGREL